MATNNTASKSSQSFVEVDKISNGIVYLKGGGMRKIVIVSGTNFDLKSGEEQNTILAGFQNFLNTLDFSTQFFVHSRKINVDGYIKKIEKRRENEENKLLKIQIEEYINFIQSFVDENAIIAKSFFVVIPYDAAEIIEQTKGILSFFKKDNGKNKEETREERIQQLNYRTEDVVEGIRQMGLRAVPLEDEELVELFYNLYNPELVDKKGVLSST